MPVYEAEVAEEDDVTLVNVKEVKRAVKRLNVFRVVRGSKFLSRLRYVGSEVD